MLTGILEDTVPTDASGRRWAQPKDIANDIIDVLFYLGDFSESEELKTTIYNHLDKLYIDWDEAMNPKPLDGLIITGAP